MKRVVVQALEGIGCQTPSEESFRSYEEERIQNGDTWEREWEREWHANWFNENAANIIKCLKDSDSNTRNMFFDMMERS